MASRQPLQTPLKTLTFNAWHGLAGRGSLKFAELEPAGRRAERERLQARAFASDEFDLVFLQELNPVEARAQALGRELSMDAVCAVDQTGIKLFKFGFPVNLRSGVGILARPELRMRTLGSLELSHEAGEFVCPWASFQLRERRVAAFAQCESPACGRLLAVVAHLHHGIEPSPEFDARLIEAVNAGELSEAERAAIKATMTAADERRAREAMRLLERIERLAVGFDSVLIGGDLNSTWRGTAYRILIEAGFSDVFADFAGGRDLRELDGPLAATWNSERNPDNRRFSRNFSLPIDDFGRAEVRSLHRAYDSRTRRIDFLLARGALAPVSAGLWADQPAGEIQGQPACLSDHFGVQAEFR